MLPQMCLNLFMKLFREFCDVGAFRKLKKINQARWRFILGFNLIAYYSISLLCLWVLIVMYYFSWVIWVIKGIIVFFHIRAAQVPPMLKISLLRVVRRQFLKTTLFFIWMIKLYLGHKTLEAWIPLLPCCFCFTYPPCLSIVTIVLALLHHLASYYMLYFLSKTILAIWW